MASLNSLPLLNHLQPSQSTLNPSKISFRGKQIKLKPNPIFRYNYFAICYNFHQNQIHKISLEKLPKYKLYYFFYPVLQLKYFLLHILLDFIPYINILWFLLLVALWLMYERAFVVYRKNFKKLPNPFKKMIYEPEICRKLNCMNKFLEVPIGVFSGVTRENDTRITVMVYNDSFRKMMTQFPCYRLLHILHGVVCGFALVLCYLWVYEALGLSNFVIPS
jgi:hypothetical protein